LQAAAASLRDRLAWLRVLSHFGVGVGIGIGVDPDYDPNADADHGKPTCRTARQAFLPFSDSIDPA